MTAEIAILNRSAVALAADSAVTIGRGSNAKTYLSENKLFELSNLKPVGLMIYNSLDFYGIPWEVLIKDFRAQKGASNCDRISDWTQCFINWLNTDRMPSKQQQDEYFSRYVKEILKRPGERFLRDILPIAVARRNGQRKKKTQEQIARVLPSVLEEARARIVDDPSIDDREKLSADGSNGNAKLVSRSELTQFMQTKADEIDNIAGPLFSNYPFSKEEKESIRYFLIDVLGRQTPTAYCSGFVIAGFGDQDMFPSLHHIIIDGVFGSQLRCFEMDYYDVDRSGYMGTIFAFAQPDVAHRFLYGVDEALESNISRYFTSAISDLTGTLASKLSLGGERKRALKEALSEAATTIENKYSSDAGNKMKEAFFSSIENMVRLMPKQEMANLAESLVNITIIKRRASSELETVGGPIDVAVVSRHEGFVWVKRKHYFSAEFNARYFWRKFRNGDKGGHS